MKLRILPLIISAVILAAHFLRSYSLVPMALCLIAPFLLFIKQRWVLVIFQGLSVFAAGIWLIALYGIIQDRNYQGRSWLASGIILGLVIIFTLFSGYCLSSTQVKYKYPG